MSTPAPVVAAYLQPPSRRGQPYTWLIDCPHCGSRHTHGAGMNGDLDGHRLSHCTDHPATPGYHLVPAEGPMPEQRRARRRSPVPPARSR
jgi:hypothetical protein